MILVVAVSQARVLGQTGGEAEQFVFFVRMGSLFFDQAADCTHSQQGQREMSGLYISIVLVLLNQVHLNGLSSLLLFSQKDLQFTI